MINTSAAEKIKEVLHTALENIGSFEECALLNYPGHLNIGDHLIWLGEVFYLTDVLKAKIKYVAVGAADFSDETMKKLSGDAPIIFHGGGNLGDLWYDHQQFREQIISKYRERPIIIMPQSIYFASSTNLKRAADIFNSHPNLTLFTRDNRSYDVATKNFHNCQVIKSPDMAFQMVKMPGLTSNPKQKHSILYHCRKDKELEQSSSPASINFPNLVVEDWFSDRWPGQKGWKSYKSMFYITPETSFERIKARIRLIRENWQRDLMNPSEWISSQVYKQLHSYPAEFNNLYEPMIHRISWSLMQRGVSQLKRHRLVITNRLHGHILCILLGIPHVFLSNSYYKNEAFYETWTYQIPFCRYVKDSSQIQIAAQELLELYSTSQVA